MKTAMRNDLNPIISCLNNSLHDFFSLNAVLFGKSSPSDGVFAMIQHILILEV